jgi:hypothetical protein
MESASGAREITKVERTLSREEILALMEAAEAIYDDDAHAPAQSTIRPAPRSRISEIAELDLFLAMTEPEPALADLAIDVQEFVQDGWPDEDDAANETMSTTERFAADFEASLEASFAALERLDTPPRNCSRPPPLPLPRFVG